MMKLYFDQSKDYKCGGVVVMLAGRSSHVFTREEGENGIWEGGEKRGESRPTEKV